MVEKVEHAYSRNTYSQMHLKMFGMFPIESDQPYRAQSQHHIAQLADSAVGQHPLDIVGHQSHRSSEDGSKATDASHYHQRCLGTNEDGETAGNQENTRRHHGGGVDQSAHRSRA